jgi:hypothetical protein
MPLAMPTFLVLVSPLQSLFMATCRADKNIPTNKGEVAAQLTSEGVIKVQPSKSSLSFVGLIPVFYILKNVPVPYL